MAATTEIDARRIRRLNDEPPADRGYVLYWMQQSQRAEFNPALEYAIQRANDANARLLVAFGLMANYPDANRRHFRFMLEGLAETAARLRERGIGFTMRRGAPADVALECARDACLVVCDRGYLRHQKQWRARVAREAGREVVEVEGDAVVPVDSITDKAEYAARTIRPKIQRVMHEHLVALRGTPLTRASDELSGGLDPRDVDGTLRALDPDGSVPSVEHWIAGGTEAAKRTLDRFLERRFDGYDERRNQPHENAVSHMSAYLHFGQISPVYVALRAREAGAPRADRDAYIEELVVRRELACNWCAFTDEYDSYGALPSWARQTLQKHRDDPRPHLYTAQELEEARTEDPWWNAAMREMRYTGYMHNHMRMYWGKKILEWTKTPELAWRTALSLNNRYFLDGRDCSSYANIGWLFGLHDRPWPERDVFGIVRSMSAGGLKRKTDPGAYVRKVDALVKSAEEAGVRF